MMIAAAHLRRGDVIAAPPPSSDEPEFDVTYNIGHDPFPAEVSGIEVRFGPRGDEPPRRFIRFTTEFRCWDDTRLINVTQRTGP